MDGADDVADADALCGSTVPAWSSFSEELVLLALLLLLLMSLLGPPPTAGKLTMRVESTSVNNEER